MLHFLLPRFAMPYRRTANVVRKLVARHDAILAAACEAAAEGGMAAVQIAPVAARAGIATGTVYRYFPSKTELVAALVAALCEREVAALEGAAKAAPGPLSARWSRASSARARPPSPTIPPKPARGSRCSRCLRCARSASSTRARAASSCRR